MSTWSAPWPRRSRSRPRTRAPWRWARSTAVDRTASTLPTRRPRSPRPICAAGCSSSARRRGPRASSPPLGATRLWCAGLVTASATAAAVRSAALGAPTYVITGWSSSAPGSGEDDLATAELIERARLGQPLRAEETAELVATSEEAARTLVIGAGHVDPADVELAVAVDAFDFAMEVTRSAERAPARPRRPGVASADADDPRQRPRHRLRGGRRRAAAGHAPRRGHARAARRSTGRSPALSTGVPRLSPRRARPRRDALGRRRTGSARDGWSTTWGVRRRARPRDVPPRRLLDGRDDRARLATRAPERLRTLVVAGITTEREPRAAWPAAPDGPGAHRARRPGVGGGPRRAHDAVRAPGAWRAARCRRSPRTSPTSRC